jgi:hypothetical protein
VENLVKGHKVQLACGRLRGLRSPSCSPFRSPVANQLRFNLHTAAYWLMLTLRHRFPNLHSLDSAELATLRLHLLKVTGRVIETASRTRIAFAAACPQAELFRGLARSLLPAGP